MTKASKRKQIEVKEDIDFERLCGPLPGAIAYLQELFNQNFEQTLDITTTGYDAVEGSVVSYREETDEEYSFRLEREAFTRRFEKEQQEAREQRQRDEAELRRLKTKLGIL
jgi:hypothetical protein